VEQFINRMMSDAMPNEEDGIRISENKKITILPPPQLSLNKSCFNPRDDDEEERGKIKLNKDDPAAAAFFLSAEKKENLRRN
jgi:hypothetical protein